jgi:hypothetical protein
VGDAGLLRLTCNIHPWMRGFIVVTDEPAAVTDQQGRFVIADVPAGSYQLRVWHETLKAVTQTVVVSAGRDTTVQAQLK